MSDNVAITAGAGTNIATDDISGVHYQMMKLVDGTLDSTTVVKASALGLFVEAHSPFVHSAVEIIRPANTTAYATKDAISDSATSPTILTFINCARSSGGSGYITKARMMTDQAANTSAFRLHLYDATLSGVNDNAAQTVLYTNRASYQGYIDFPYAATDGSDTATSQATQPPFPFVASGTSLFGMLETINGFTPASGQKFYIQLGIDQN